MVRSPGELEDFTVSTTTTEPVFTQTVDHNAAPVTLAAVSRQLNVTEYRLRNLADNGKIPWPFKYHEAGRTYFKCTDVPIIRAVITALARS
jgi:hypothetical protein